MALRGLTGAGTAIQDVDDAIDRFFGRSSAAREPVDPDLPGVFLELARWREQVDARPIPELVGLDRAVDLVVLAGRLSCGPGRTARLR